MAVYQDKHIIPVFMDLNDVPDILKIQIGVNASNKTPENLANEIYRHIAKRFDIQGVG